MYQPSELHLIDDPSLPCKVTVTPYTIQFICDPSLPCKVTPLNSYVIDQFHLSLQSPHLLVSYEGHVPHLFELGKHCEFISIMLDIVFNRSEKS